MSNHLFLAVLETVAILSCTYGMYSFYLTGTSVVGIIYNGLWFILGFLSNLFGLIALYLVNFGAEEELEQSSQYYQQHHYFLAWLTIVVGYPSFVTQVWMAHHASGFVHLHILLTIIPMIAWVQRKTQIIVSATQTTTAIAILSHAYISYLVWNFWGLVGAGLMVANVIALSMPTGYNIWGFSSRELYVIGLAGTSYIFCLATTDATMNPVPIQVKDLFPFFKYIQDAWASVKCTNSI